ncbi:MAG: YdcF family protein [Nitrospirota bacterium]
MLRGLESDFNIPQNPEGDVIILLGGGVYDRAPDLSGIGAPSGDMLERFATAIRLQKRLNIPIIVSGGSAFKNKKPEAPIVKRFLIDLGVPANKVIVEDKSRDTIENAKYTVKICKKSGYKKPLLVTSANHMKRSLLSFEKAGVKVMPFPAGFRTWQNKKYEWKDYLPNAGALRDSYIAMNEYLGSLFYRFAY